LAAFEGLQHAIVCGFHADAVCARVGHRSVVETLAIACASLPPMKLTFSMVSCPPVKSTIAFACRRASFWPLAVLGGELV